MYNGWIDELLPHMHSSEPTSLTLMHFMPCWALHQ